MVSSLLRPITPEVLDPALFRRSHYVIRYALPDDKIVTRILKNCLSPFDTDKVDWESVIKSAEGMSQSELVRAADEAAKRAVLAEHTMIVQDDLSAAIAERKAPTRT